MFGKKIIEVNAILDTQVEEVLKRTNQYEKFINGEILCKSCGTIINSQNIGIIQPINKKEINFYCERIDCAEEFKNSKK